MIAPLSFDIQSNNLALFKIYKVFAQLDRIDVNQCKEAADA